MEMHSHTQSRMESLLLTWSRNGVAAADMMHLLFSVYFLYVCVCFAAKVTHVNYVSPTLL